MAKVPPPIPKKRASDTTLVDSLVLLETDPGQLHAALHITLCLVAEDRPFQAAEAAARLVDSFLRRGDLPRAALAAAAAEEGTLADDHFQRIADAFGQGSARLSDTSPAPPPLPASVEHASIDETGDALLDRAEEALSGFMEWSDPAPTDAKLPLLPLFSDLQPTALAELLRAFESRVVTEGATLIEEGEEGRDAFVVADGVLDVSREERGQRTILAALGPGALFGEMALVSDAPRAASVQARTDAIVMAVSRAKLETLSKKTPEIATRLGEFCRGRMLANLMRHSDLLCAVPSAERTALVSRFETVHFEAGDVLVEKAEEGKALFLIASGAVAVDGKDGSGDTVRITELGPGDVVGEISLILRRPANAQVHALHPTVALRLDRDAFQAAIKAHPTLLNELYEMATDREEETRSLVAQETIDTEDIVLI